ncbi:PREDICTED: E3 ubiquitin-protein ligase Mdm2-like [Ceratosolen solmsi marchali]|uniref:E3 ubiquitin-protein ligase Mdm2-like n=1 Tax=Ceratosolen solmsi marchali TaxID=326594 RepID=A0AAJ6YEY8_9HYME|nr:PREDICTED: E3 ubiquitin-protein ligase Mdm2-like [Ceratosolen solmsi marchali]
MGWYFILESESSLPTDEDDESIYSMQENETEYVRDTSDTSTSHSWMSSSENDANANLEYELDSRSENENPLMAVTSSSEPENKLEVKCVSVCESEEVADGSNDSVSSIDSEIRKTKFLICIQCKNLNTNTLFRYCKNCYQLRKTHFPRYEARRKHRHRKESTLRNFQSSLSMFPKEPRSWKEVKSEVVSSSDRPIQDTESLCLICTVKPKNGAFVHGKITHICCCYGCAMKAWMTNSSRCPICNRKVSQILKVFYA